MTNHSFTAVHARKGKIIVEAPTTYEAAKAAAQHWRLKSTAGIDVLRNDLTHTFS